MKSSLKTGIYNIGFIAFTILFSPSIKAQEKPLSNAKTNAFWERVNFGGGFGLSIGNNFTNITIAPTGIYNFNDYFALGTGLQYSYLKEKNSYTSNVFGASLIGLFNPIREIQLSLEVEQINVNNKYIDLGGNYNHSFWNTGLFVGGGYREGGVTVGGRLNLLFDSNKDIYGSAFMPFVRVFF